MTMIAPKTLELAFEGVQAAVTHLVSLRGLSDYLRIKDDETLQVMSSEGWARVQIDDLLTILLSMEPARDTAAVQQFFTALKPRLVNEAIGVMNWRHQLRQIIKLISMRRLRAATTEDRRAMVAMLAYARASLSFSNNRPNGLAAAIDTLHLISRHTAFLGEFEADLQSWAEHHKKQRKLTSLIKLQCRIERQIAQLAA